MKETLSSKISKLYDEYDKINKLWKSYPKKKLNDIMLAMWIKKKLHEEGDGK